MVVVADTSFLVDVQRARPNAVAMLERLRDEGETILIPSIVAAEFLAGFKDPAAALQVLEEAGEIHDFTQQDALAAARVARRSIEAGRFPGWPDLLIAGFAEARDVPVLTSNARHFRGTRTTGG
jgi:predicted nucleic acid-binding protein